MGLTWLVSGFLALMAGVGLLFFDNPPKPGEHPSVNALLLCLGALAGTLIIPPVFQLWTRRTTSTAQVVVRLLICAAAYAVPFLIPPLDMLLNG